MMRGEFALRAELPQKLQENPLRLKKKFSPTTVSYTHLDVYKRQEMIKDAQQEAQK